METTYVKLTFDRERERDLSENERDHLFGLPVGGVDDVSDGSEREGVGVATTGQR